MTPKTFDIFIYEINSKAPKKKYALNKIDAYHIDDICSLGIIDLKITDLKK